jgi:hypothetical protein
MYNSKYFMCKQSEDRPGLHQKKYNHRDRPPQRWGGPTPQIGCARASLASVVAYLCGYIFLLGFSKESQAIQSYKYCPALVHEDGGPEGDETEESGEGREADD